MKVITCFSYKGGSGRTTAASNIAAALSSVTGNVGAIETPLNHKVALIDLDVFSAGTHRVFEISNDQIETCEVCVQDYLRQQMEPASYAKQFSIGLEHPFMEKFRMGRGGANNCHPGFLLFPAKPDPEARFIVQKQHENVLIELLMELEGGEHKFDYVILDGESGTRQMADIAIRLADVVLMFFRLTWQHIEGTLNTALAFQQRGSSKPFYLIPTCVPLIAKEDGVYLRTAPGLTQLEELTERIPEDSNFNEFTERFREGPGHFWADDRRLCVHDSLILKGEERILVFDANVRKDRAAVDYYRIASELSGIHDPDG